MTSAQVSIQGDGVAACCCAHLLRKQGMRVSAAHAVRPTLPVVLLNSSTQLLLCDVFGDSSIFRDALPIKKRIVLWGRQAEPVAVAHAGVAMPEADLLQRLWRTMPDKVAADQGEENGWSIRSARTQPEDVRHFGARIANAATVQLNAKASPGACWVESLDGGWLFLLPTSGGNGSMLSVGASAETLLGKSRLVADQIQELKDSNGSFPAYPRILYPPSGTSWIACGTAAMGFDPICGEGVGHAVREAILASAVIQAIANGLPEQEVLTHYSGRLLAGFFRHLTVCRDFYSSAHDSEWWSDELRLIESGLEWTRERILEHPAPQYRLTGFDLERCF